MSTLSSITPALLLSRLDAIGRSLARTDDALALIGLGSVGLEHERLDARSDLDFFVVVAQGHKRRFVDTPDWLEGAHPLAWHFQNTADGCKALMTDGVFCEFAVFEPDELTDVAFAPGRLVWRRDGVPDAIATPRRALPSRTPPSQTWIVGEALSCLFVGMQRWHRGERLSAARFVQAYALDRLLELDALRAPVADKPVADDPFNRDRRAEQRHPGLAAELHALLPGYAHTPGAVMAMLAALQRRNVPMNEAIVQRIRELVLDA